MVYISRKEFFNAAHRLYNPSWSKEENEAHFGPCANEYFHGHNFELTVTVVGNPNPDTGFVIDLKRLGNLMKTLIVDKIDHKNLNMDVPGLMNILPSTENMAIFIWDILMPKVKTMGAELHSVKLCETENNYVEYFGGK